MQIYKNGCRSPFLYIETIRLWRKNPELLKTMDVFEIHALYYGAMNGLVGEELAEWICALAPGRNSSTACIKGDARKAFYESIDEGDADCVCCLLIKGNVRGKRELFVV